MPLKCVFVLHSVVCTSIIDKDLLPSNKEQRFSSGQQTVIILDDAELCINTWSKRFVLIQEQKSLNLCPETLNSTGPIELSLIKKKSLLIIHA